MSRALPPAGERPPGAAGMCAGCRLVVFCALLAVLLTGVRVVALFTMPHWYRPWMPSTVGQLGFPLRHVADLRAAAQRNDLDPALVAAVIYVGEPL